MSDMQCPYCDADQEVCHDDGAGYDEDVMHEHTCSECEKVFVFETFVSFYYTSRKADCLNGAPHQWKMTRTHPRRFSRMQCTDCGERRTPTDKEFAAAGIIE